MTEHAQKFWAFFFYLFLFFIIFFYCFLVRAVFRLFSCFGLLVRYYPDDMSTQQAVEDDEIEGDREEEEVGYS